MSDVYYDPYDWDIDTDPYPVWKRLRDEAPLYYNEKYDFYALSRYDDVERCSVDWRTYISGKGSVLEIIKSGMEMPPGNILFEDPPAHDMHRCAPEPGLHSASGSPTSSPRSASSAPARSIRYVGSERFDFILDLGAQMPMRTIGMLLGIPEEDQEAIRERIDDGFKMETARCPTPSGADLRDPGIGDDFVDYVEWRSQHPSDDLMTELLTRRVRGRDRAQCARSRGTRSSTTSDCSTRPATRRRPG